jgi:hypothetical protein
MLPLIRVNQTHMHIHDLEIEHRDVARYFEKIPEPDHAAALTEVIALGVRTIEAAGTSRDLGFVRREIDGVPHTVMGIPEITSCAR